MGPSVLLCPLLAVHFRSSDKNLKKIVKMHHQNEFLVFVFLVIAIRTCHTFPRPINPDVGSPVVDVAKETEYEEHRDAHLIESINGGQSGRALLFPYNGVLPLELNDRPKRQDNVQTDNIETATEENAEEISKSKLPESYAGRFEGLDIGNILSIAGAEPQAFTRGEASYGRKRRNAGEEEEEEIITEDDVVPETTTEKTESKLPESYAGRFKGLNIANILSIAGAKPQAFTRGEASYGRKRRNAEEEEEEDVEAKNEEIPDAMADQMTEIENVQALWMEFLQHGISSRRKRQNDIEATDDNQGKVDPSNTKITVPIQVKVKNWGETGIESQVVGDNRKKRQSLELLDEGAIQDNDDTNSKPLEVKVKYWGETGIQSPKIDVNNPRKKRQSLEFNLEEAIENEFIMQDIFQATDDLNVINIPIEIVEVKNWGETGIQKPSDSI